MTCDYTVRERYQQRDGLRTYGSGGGRYDRPAPMGGPGAAPKIDPAGQAMLGVGTWA